MTTKVSQTGITHADIEQSRHGFAVSARVFFQEITPDGRAGPQVREVKNWTNVNISLNLQGPGQATISFTNTQDKLMSVKYGRSLVDGVSKISDVSVSQSDLQGYLEVVAPLLQGVKYLNLARSPSNFESEDDFITDYLNYAYELVSSSSSRDKSENIDSALLQRVFIDLVGRDGKVYAGFSGIVSALNDDMKVGESLSLNFVCKDLWRVLQFSELFMKEGQGTDQVNESAALNTQKQMSHDNFYQSSLFDGMTGLEAIHILLDIVQGSFTNEGFSQSTAGVVATSTFDANRKNFFYQEKFWDLSPSQPLISNFEGITPLRRVKSAKTLSEVSLGGKTYKPGALVPGRDDGLGIKDGDLVSQLIGDVYIDRFIEEGPQAVAYRKVVDGFLQPFQSQRARGDAILRRIADCTYYDVFFDGNGNLIYQIPKYNNFPGEFGPAVTSVNVTSDMVPDAKSSKGAEKYPRTQFDYGDFSSKGDYDFSPQPENLAVKGHGLNYIIADLSLQGWGLVNSEEPIVTFVRVPVGINLIKQDEVIANGYQAGVTLGDNIVALQRRYGMRTVETQQLFLPRWASNDRTTKVDKGISDAFASAAMNVLNSLSHTGNVSLTFRPDLGLGKTVFMVERQRLYYLVGINHSIPMGGVSSTQLALSNGHDIGERIVNPWIAVRDLVPESTVEASVQPGMGLKIDTSFDYSSVQQKWPQTTVFKGEGAPAPGYLITPWGRLAAIDYFTRGTIRGAEKTYGQFLANPESCDYYQNPANKNHVILSPRSDFKAQFIRSFTLINGQTIQLHKWIGPLVVQIFNQIYQVLDRSRWYVTVTNAFVPRYAWGVPPTPPSTLSPHTFGVAVDVYVKDKLLDQDAPENKWSGGGHPYPPNDLIKDVFSKYGFFWGAGFRDVDPIHWQWFIPDGGYMPPQDVLATAQE